MQVHGILGLMSLKIHLCFAHYLSLVSLSSQALTLFLRYFIVNIHVYFIEAHVENLFSRPLRIRPYSILITFSEKSALQILVVWLVT